jgi:prepilin-type N-terminal cleavage/methylation domain-containing protein
MEMKKNSRVCPERSGTGFTLVEILVVLSVFAVIVTVGGNLFFSVLRGATKTKASELVKQNGNYALTSMERNIHNAKQITDYDDTGGTYLEIKNPDGKETEYFCGNVDADSDLEIASNSASLINSSEVRVTSCNNVFTVDEGEEGVSPDVVTISFTLAQTKTTPRPEEQSTINFKTTVTLRNY